MQSRRGDVAQVQVVGQRRRGSSSARTPGSVSSALASVAKASRCAVLQHVQRLDAEPVAADQQPASARVPQREVEHAVQAMHEVVAVGGRTGAAALRCRIRS